MTTQTLTRRPSFAIGDEVTANEAMFGTKCRGTVYVITSVPAGARGVNYIARPRDNPAGRGIRSPFDGLVAHEQGAPAPSPVIRYEYVEAPKKGAVVTVSHGLKGVQPTDLMVVLGESQGSVRNAVRLTRIGGDGGRYWPSVPIKNLTVIDPTTIRVA